MSSVIRVVKRGSKNRSTGTNRTASMLGTSISATTRRGRGKDKKPRKRRGKR